MTDEKTRELDDPPQMFDSTFKYLLHSASRPALVRFINGIFGKDYPPDSAVAFHATESETKRDKNNDIEKIMSDMILTVSPKDADTDAFLLEAQTARDENMALRVFQYAYAYARQNKHRADDDNLITLTMPDAKVFYWETAGGTHEELICRLVFPDKSIHDYTAGTVKVFERSIEEMAAAGMTLLLPFSILKIRNEVKKAGLTAGRRGDDALQD